MQRQVSISSSPSKGCVVRLYLKREKKMKKSYWKQGFYIMGNKDINTETCFLRRK
jgi:hypothetical protein